LRVIHAAKERGSDETGSVSHDTTAQRQQTVFPPHAMPNEPVVELLHRVEVLESLPLGYEQKVTVEPGIRERRTKATAVKPIDLPMGDHDDSSSAPQCSELWSHLVQEPIAQENRIGISQSLETSYGSSSHRQKSYWNGLPLTSA